MAKPDAETPVIEVDDIPQGLGRTVVEVRRAGGEASEDRSLESTDVLALAADHGAAGIGYFVDLSGERAGFAGNREDRQTSNVEDWWCFFAGIRNANVERRLDRMVADVRRVVASAAEAGNGLDIEIIVESGDTGDVDFGVVEQFFTAGHRAAMLVHHPALVIVATPVVGDVDGLEELRGIRNGHGEVAIVVSIARIEPWTVYIENLRRERGSFRIKSERIVDSDEELLRRKGDRTAFGIVAGQELRLVVENLGGEDAKLKGNDFVQLRVRGRSGRLGVAEGGIASLAFKIRGETLPCILAPVPHNSAQETHIGGRQRTPVHRQNAGARLGIRAAAIGIINCGNGKFRRRRDRKADTDQAFFRQQFVGALLCSQC